MAERPAFFIRQGSVVTGSYTFEWFPGFAASQKQKSIESLHYAIMEADAGAKPLEISTRSREAVGRSLSAFRLKWKGRALENIFQSSKVFENGGPYLDLLDVPPRDAKRDERLRSSGALKAFRCRNETFPLLPKTVFYDFLYIAAVKDSLAAEEIKEVSHYNYFTDIEFHPAKSINTQARAAAIIKLMLEEYGRLPDFEKEDFIQYHKAHVTY
nr:hypothetical protein [uncultured Oscillibacter sp.]